MTAYEVIVLLVIGLLGGFVAGSLGVGGGIIIVPALVFIFGMSQHHAQGTSLAVLLPPISLLAVLKYHKDGYIDYKFALILAITFFLGSYLGGLFAVNLPAKTLKKIFGILMLLAGIKMIFGK